MFGGMAGRRHMERDITGTQLETHFWEEPPYARAGTV